MVGTTAKAIAKARPFEICPSKSPAIKRFGLQMVDFRSPLFMVIVLPAINQDPFRFSIFLLGYCKVVQKLECRMASFK